MNGTLDTSFGEDRPLYKAYVSSATIVVRAMA
jgi:hypothetical protein